MKAICNVCHNDPTQCPVTFTANRHSAVEMAEYARVASSGQAARRSWAEMDQWEKEKAERAMLCPVFRLLPKSPWYEIYSDPDTDKFLEKFPNPRAVMPLLTKARAALGDTWYDWSEEAASVAESLLDVYIAGFRHLFRIFSDPPDLPLSFIRVTTNGDHAMTIEVRRRDGRYARIRRELGVPTSNYVWDASLVGSWVLAKREAQRMRLGRPTEVVSLIDLGPQPVPSPLRIFNKRVYGLIPVGLGRAVALVDENELSRLRTYYIEVRDVFG